ncbi:MAG: hypothetical protein F6K30_25240, partial [Cyanothece sp. SIO2G6]|nr:hypothetical protein [Cyanothece sp. SIO2G6]
LPESLSTGGSTPILAFWKQEPLQTAIRDACGNGSEIAGTPCIAGHAYALVVYSTDTGDSDIWDGRSRITRYELNKYTVGAGAYAETGGFVDPSSYGNEFRSWPYYQGTGDSQLANKQADRPGGTSDVLVDFVDDQARSPSCPNGYGYSVPELQLTGFYGCVSDDDATDSNRDVILYLRGNAYGRPAIGSENAFLPIIETHVLSRPVLNKTTAE